LISDLSGLTGLTIIQAILDGERNRYKLAALAMLVFRQVGRTLPAVWKATGARSYSSFCSQSSISIRSIRSRSQNVTPPWRPICKPSRTRWNRVANRLWRRLAKKLAAMPQPVLIYAGSYTASAHGPDSNRWHQYHEPANHHRRGGYRYEPFSQPGPLLRPFWAYVRTIRLPEARCSAEARGMSRTVRPPPYAWPPPAYGGVRHTWELSSVACEPVWVHQKPSRRWPTCSPPRLPYAALWRTVPRQGDEVLRREISRTRNPQHSEKGEGISASWFTLTAPLPQDKGSF